MTKFIEQRSVGWVSEHIPGAKRAMREYGIAPNSRMALDVAAAAASVTPDALLAEINYRDMIAARRLRKRRAAEFELV